MSFWNMKESKRPIYKVTTPAMNVNAIEVGEYESKIDASLDAMLNSFDGPVSAEARTGQQRICEGEMDGVDDYEGKHIGATDFRPILILSSVHVYTVS